MENSRDQVKTRRRISRIEGKMIQPRRNGWPGTHPTLKKSGNLQLLSPSEMEC